MLLRRGADAWDDAVRFEFSGFSIDSETAELRRGGAVVAIEPQVFDVLFYLIKNRDRVVSQDELVEVIWSGRAISPSALTSRINAARTAIGDSGAAQALIKTLPRKGYRFIGDVIEGTYQLASIANSNTEQLSKQRQHVQFCTSGNEVKIAWAEVGEGSPIVKAGNWLNHLEYDWESPIWSHMLHWLAEEHKLVRYDARGNGLSDWDAQDISFDAFVRDLEAVVDAAGLKQFALFGASQGCAVSIAYAVRHPERVSKLVLYGGFAKGRRMRGEVHSVEQAEAMVTLMRTGWGQDNPAFRQVFTSLFVPSGTQEQMNWFNDLQRKTTSADNAVRMRLVSDTLDVSELLPRVSVPTLVLHCRGDAVQPFEEGRKIAAGIPGAQFVGLDGVNHLILETDACWPRFQEEVKAFLAA